MSEATRRGLGKVDRGSKLAAVRSAWRKKGSGVRIVVNTWANDQLGPTSPRSTYSVSQG